MKTINVVEVINDSPVIWAFPKTKIGRKQAETLFLTLAKENDLPTPKKVWNLSDGEGYDLVIVESQKQHPKLTKNTFNVNLKSRKVVK